MNEPILLRKQIIGLLILLLTVCLLEGIIYLLPNPQPAHEPTPVPDSLVTKTKPLYSRDTITLHLQPFDPNTADSITLRQLGLRPWHITNIRKYKAKNGTFRSKKHFRRLYGLTDSAFHALEPYILLPDSLPERDTLTTDTTPFDSTRFHQPSHLKRDTIIELNTADTASLQFIKGIGLYTAIQILKYRNALGGYHNAEQVREITDIDYAEWDSIIPHLTADTTLITQLKVNNASVKQLQKHPYLNFTQAKALYELRRENIHLHSIKDLNSLPLTDKEKKRLAPYLDFSVTNTPQ
ncbi:MAG: helix-hairpin-helix domain-containing protein [Paludibacteraceae bacterium]|nr:helix-hairpin-helix domain-containing protein [Paludibacteraceae bacterium]